MMEGAIFWFCMVAVVAATVVARKRERRWRANLLEGRRQLDDQQIGTLYRELSLHDRDVLRIVRAISATLHVKPWQLRPDDALASLQAPYWSITDDLWALDNALADAQHADKEMARKVRTVADVVKLVAAAEVNTGRRIV